MGTGLWNVLIDGRAQLARGPVDAGPAELIDGAPTLTAALAEGGASLGELLSAPAVGPVPTDAPLLAPVADELVWASGVTYERSRDARMEESDDLDVYDLVYEAERPELFIKSSPERVRAQGEAIAIRADSDWNVPEPELGVVADATRRIVAYVIGNDVSSRSIEGENPLYLPQAKTYDGGCAIGPCLVPVEAAPGLADLRITLQIHRGAAPLFEESIAIERMRRRPAELVDWLFRAQRFPNGVVLLTGTGIVPDRDFTLQPDDQVAISVPGLGVLRNHVEVVGTDEGRPRAAAAAD